MQSGRKKVKSSSAVAAQTVPFFLEDLSNDMIQYLVDMLDLGPQSALHFLGLSKRLLSVYFFLHPTHTVFQCLHPIKKRLVLTPFGMAHRNLWLKKVFPTFEKMVLELPLYVLNAYYDRAISVNGSINISESTEIEVMQEQLKDPENRKEYYFRLFRHYRDMLDVERIRALLNLEMMGIDAFSEVYDWSAKRYGDDDWLNTLKYEKTILHLTAQMPYQMYKAEREKIIEMIKLILERGANINAKLRNIWFVDGDTPLALAIQHGRDSERIVYDVERVKCLIDHGADVKSETVPTYFTSLHYAAQAGSVPMMRLLIEAGAVINTYHDTVDGKVTVATPLSHTTHASSQHMINAFQFLLFHNSIDLRDEFIMSGEALKLINRWRFKQHGNKQYSAWCSVEEKLKQVTPTEVLCVTEKEPWSRSLKRMADLKALPSSSCARKHSGFFEELSPGEKKRTDRKDARAKEDTYLTSNGEGDEPSEEISAKDLRELKRFRRD